MPGSLTTLSTHHKNQLEIFLTEFDVDPSELHGYFCPRSWPIERVVKSLDGWGRGVGLDDGWVPCTTHFWIKDDVIQGVINIRHSLTPSLEEIGGHIGYCVAPTQRRQGVATSMLAAALPLCQRLGITRALLTCDAENVASAKTIERCGGILDREAWSERAQKTQRWYWIDLSSL